MNFLRSLILFKKVKLNHKKSLNVLLRFKSTVSSKKSSFKFFIQLFPLNLFMTFIHTFFSSSIHRISLIISRIFFPPIHKNPIDHFSISIHRQSTSCCSAHSIVNLLSLVRSQFTCIVDDIHVI